jgi:hypothetical protein
MSSSSVGALAFAWRSMTPSRFASMSSKRGTPREDPGAFVRNQKPAVQSKQPVPCVCATEDAPQGVKTPKGLGVKLVCSLPSSRSASFVRGRWLPGFGWPGRARVTLEI